MRLLIDTDMFCKLGVTGLLADAFATLGVTPEECGRLPALPHMLRRGRIVKRYGATACSALLPTAMAMPAASAPDEKFLAPLVDIAAIDPGEAQLLALTAEHSLLLLSGDKRALSSVARLSLIRSSLDGKIITFEAILLALCRLKGVPAVRSGVNTIADLDTLTRICFSPNNKDPCSALISYFADMKEKIRPLTLWEPTT